MTTATKDETRTQPLEKRKDRYRDLLQKLEDARRREDELDEEIAAKMAEGESPNGLKEERREVRELVRDLEAALPVIRGRIRDQEREELTDRAEKRLRQVKKAAGGLAGEAPRRVERARELAAELSDVLDWLAGVRVRRRFLREEARLLADRFELEVPELKPLDVDPGSVIRECRQAARASGPRTSVSEASGLRAVGFLEKLYDVDSPTPELVERMEGLDEDA